MNTQNTALVIGASGGLGTALAQALRVDVRYSQVLSLSRSSADPDMPALDYADESSLVSSAQWVASQCIAAPLRLVIVATGYLHTDGAGPERSLAQLDIAYLQRVMLVNTIGPALVAKHFAPLLPRDTAVRMVMVSAKVGSIGDNALGGWYGYRASKAALNQMVKTIAIDMSRRNKLSICVALHPGTVATRLSEPFGKAGLNVRTADVAAAELLRVIHCLEAPQTGGFFDYRGESLPW
jgi:NAD(P)-dependent dehydrogenase (short-subunit alcohol dehydrogenase family)